MNETKYLVGIDLGTSNCAVAFVDLARGADAPVEDFPIAQLVRPAQVSALSGMASCIYLPGPHELIDAAVRLPWTEPRAEPGEVIVGEFARWQGTRVPDRLITSAKSWLCHPGVDRFAAILPWGAPAEVRKLSPLDASAHLLAHLARAWNHAHPEAPIARQEVILTVPASFDEVARSLTVAAAQPAGFETLTLVEEPQAAFYDFLARHRDDLADALAGIRLVLVVDVGGGTSDFTLVQTAVSPKGAELRRIAVGDHLMLGGDNMDAAISRAAESRMLSGGRKLSPGQWSQLTQAARMAKEKLLGREVFCSDVKGKGLAESEDYNLSIVSEGSRLVGGSLSTRITRAEAEQITLEGFFPKCGRDAAPRQGARAGLQELGLPYAHEPAVTRHLAAFLRAHAATSAAALGSAPAADHLPRPDAILLNGGVFNSPKISERLVDAVSSWWPGRPRITLLHHDSLELAVARGAAYCGLARRGLGRRIGGGAGHALYVGLEKEGSQMPLALCLIPRGHEEGETIEIAERVFKLSLGSPVRFPLFSTAADRLDRRGDVVTVTDELRPLPPIHTVLTSRSGSKGHVPVHLRATLTEIGTLELWCVSNTNQERWRLEFELRGEAGEPVVIATESAARSLADARRGIESIFGGRAAPNKGSAQPCHTSLQDVKQLWNNLEKMLGPREEWSLPALRELWSAAVAGAARRRRSAEHERIFFQLLGYCLRPGFGFPLDEWRCEQSVRLFFEGVQFNKEKSVWNEFWILWRRLAGGLSEARHQELWNYLKPFLAHRIPPKASAGIVRPKGLQPEGVEEMARLAGALEHVAVEEKIALGNWIAARLGHSELARGPWTWTLGRLGARALVYGSAHKVVPPEMAVEWIALLLQPQVLRIEGALFSLAQLARRTGDRTRDVDDASREQVLTALKSAKASPSWLRMAEEIVALDATDKARALGDSLPAGLLLT